MNKIKHPLMSDNITRKDIDTLIEFLQQEPIPKLTNGPQVVEFERQWSEWLGVKHSLMVNSGSSANELTMLAIKHLKGPGSVIVPALTWISDISSVLFAGLNPLFCDINLSNLAFDIDHLKKLITLQNNVKAVFLTHVLGINGLTQELIDICEDNNILLIEDVCESHGATMFDSKTNQIKKVGSFGYASNFSFYFAHHMSTIEGGMICTNDTEFYQFLRSLRSHGMLRESTDDNYKAKVTKANPQLNPDFIFVAPAHNYRSTEINAVLGISQLENLDSNNQKRIRNFDYFINNLDREKYITELNTEGQCNYAFIVILRDGTFEKRDVIENLLREKGVEFRRGLSGGGNQTLQPFIKSTMPQNQKNFPNVNYVHNFAWYIGNFPQLSTFEIDELLDILNNASI